MGFSRASRRRLGRLLYRVRFDALPTCHFATLTFHDVPEAWLDRFRAFLQHLRRSDAQYLWRLELQRRGAPHFHLMIWSISSDLEQLRHVWHSIANPESAPHERYGFHVSPIGSFRQASAYLRKYMAKVDSPDNIRGTALEGRRIWGASRNLPIHPHVEFDFDPDAFHRWKRVCRGLLRARERSRVASLRSAVAAGKHVAPRQLKPRRLSNRWGSSGVWLPLSWDLQVQFLTFFRHDLSAPFWSRMASDRPPEPSSSPADFFPKTPRVWQSQLFPTPHE